VGEYASKSTGAGPTGALIESWNGATWSVVPGASVTVAYLYGVSCVSGRSCKAVGEYDSSSRGARPTASLVESWDGAAWSV
jgi:hypothetical protein